MGSGITQRSLFRTITAVIFLSGLSALLYQVIWIRHINLIFGVHVYSTSTVVASFMAGISLGSYFLGKSIDKAKSPVIIFILLELIIGIYGLFFFNIIKLLNHSILSLYFLNNTSSFFLYLIKFSFSFLILFIPTFLMGGTLPVASRIVIKQLPEVGHRVGVLYGSNNLGALVGIFAGVFFLLRNAGLRNSEFIAVAGNMVNVFVLTIIALRLKTSRLNSKDPVSRHSGQQLWPGDSDIAITPMFILMVGIFFEGFTTLGYEILWTRLFLEFSSEKTVYAYSVIILGFIAGLSAGSLLYSRFPLTRKDRFRLFGLIEILIAVTAAAGFIIFMKTSPHLVEIQGLYTRRIQVVVNEYFFILPLIIFPSILMGYTFPLLSSIMVRRMQEIGKNIGILGFLDNFGAIFGALIAGFILIPVFNLYTSYNILIIINLITGLTILLFSIRRKGYVLKASGLSILFLTGYFLVLPQRAYQNAKINYHAPDKVVAYSEGVEATVTVNLQSSGYKVLTINGAKTAYANSEDIRVHKMLGFLPWLFDPDPHSAFIIGFGMGVTADALVETGLTRIDIAEISPGVVKLSSDQFSSLNQRVFLNPKVNLVYEDGRSYLNRCTQKFDIITTNAVHARIGANLYTREFYQLCKSKLNDGGTVCQWLPTNWLSAIEYRSLIKAFIDVFPYSSLWYITRSHTLLVGSLSAPGMGFDELINRYNSSPVHTSMMDAEIYDAPSFFGLLMMDGEELKSFCSGAPDNLDDNPVVEYSRYVDMKPNPDILKKLVSSRSTILDVLSGSKIETHSDSLNYLRSIYMNTFYKEEINRFIETISE